MIGFVSLNLKLDNQLGTYARQRLERRKVQITNQFEGLNKSYQLEIKAKSELKKIIQKSSGFFLASGLALFLNSGVVFANPEVKPENMVLDESGSLTKSSISYLEKTYQKLSQNYGINAYMVSIRSLPYGVEANEYAKELFEKWNLNEKDMVIVLVNKIAKGGIFAGPSVSGLDNSMIKSINEETYTFKARDEQYSSAALDVTNRLVSILSNKGDPGAPNLTRESGAGNYKSAKNTEQKRSKYVAIIVVLLVIAFVVPMVQFFYYVKDE